jgi:hypothetical protein
MDGFCEISYALTIGAGIEAVSNKTGISSGPIVRLVTSHVAVRIREASTPKCESHVRRFSAIRLFRFQIGFQIVGRGSEAFHQEV